MKHSLSCNLKRCDAWVRLLYILVAVVCFFIARIIIVAIAIVQWVLFLLTRECNPALRNFGQSLSSYVYELTRFLTFASNRRPFPFSDWPTGTVGESEEEDATEVCEHCSCGANDHHATVSEATNANTSDADAGDVNASHSKAESPQKEHTENPSEPSVTDVDIIVEPSTKEASATSSGQTQADDQETKEKDKPTS